MAKRCNKVLLGFEDEAITDKYKQHLDFTCNKFGGKPDWPTGENYKNPNCQLCGLSLPLILQIYAPVENPFHRTLYIFACINPNCWNQKGSWVCLRVQVLSGSSVRPDVTQTQSTNATEWCDEADNWEDEQNGNMIEVLNNQIQEPQSSDEENDVTSCMANLNVDERNANREMGSLSGAQGGAMGRLLSPTATAEIEGDESEVVTIDTPPSAQVNIISLFEQATPVPQIPSSNLYFAPYFVSVGEEEQCLSNSPTNAEHVRELLQGYQQWGIDDQTLSNQTSSNSVGDLGGGENYERSIPAHGDKMFHSFLSRIQVNPGQILRYCWEGGKPLFLYPPNDLPSRCQHCQGELIFELQILPTIIPRLRLISHTNADPAGHLEFGSVFLLSCRRSCWNLGDSFREEHLVVQTEKI
ncbi:programmed cell death 2 like trus [Lycorma delicatula]|uniref:programmed cell death 2 like trus n=1 Tax=Lycorma delicatula TaxID=130591 RepID=UPI003F51487F